ncbi:hypothetical protein R6258_13300 [Halomonas sp. HP20-15]|uniref:hypothetical protein n=1 Tax=Halomonas sp. HP20-15 TaxID=3085901 RepID=UPI00298229E4|nr:hypothetical protein [Halomonas sp. HP20-15]MDW5377901.1 hypothetical protein [Halomonas sp. HP20-15]
MLELSILFLIYVGVALSIYQLYDIYCNQSQSIEEEDEKTHARRQVLKSLALKADEHARTGESSGFIQAVKAIYGPDIDPRMVLTAFSAEKPQDKAEALLRRKNNIVVNGRIKILHLSFWKTNPPAVDIRGTLLTVIIFNSLAVLFLGGLSVYTIAYEVSIDYLTWANSSLVLMLLVYSLIVLTHLLAKFDMYMHDIHQIGQLNASFSSQE